MLGVFSRLLSAALSACWLSLNVVNGSTKPNFIVFFVDDMGYGDLGFTGHPSISTPNVDRLAREGMVLTQWYSGFHICTPSRAALMTGRLPVRSGMAGPWTGDVLYQDAVGGLPLNETTLAEQLRDNAGYATSMIGKWHLGQRPEYLPTSRGFDEYLGVPFSVDMGDTPWLGYTEAEPPLPLLDGLDIIEQPADLSTVTKRYVERMRRFILANAAKNRPFFAYVAFNHVHMPLFVGDAFCNSSIRGRYGDNMEEMDWAVGEIMQAVEDAGVSSNTATIFTSDNGPWLDCNLAGGSASLFRSGKHTTWEGGIRMPAVAHWPGQIQSRTRNMDALVATYDIFPTLLSLAGVSLPKDRVYDGIDISNVLFGDGSESSNRRCVYHYGGSPGAGNNITGQPCMNNVDCPGLFAMRCDQYKLHFVTMDINESEPTFQDPPLLYDVNSDPSELHPIWPDNEHYDSIVQDLLNERNQFEQTMDTTVKNQILAGRNEVLSLCCDVKSKLKYPEYPDCTCSPEVFNKEICEPVCADSDTCGDSSLPTNMYELYNDDSSKNDDQKVRIKQFHQWLIERRKKSISSNPSHPNHYRMQGDPTQKHYYSKKPRRNFETFYSWQMEAPRVEVDGVQATIDTSNFSFC